MIFSYRTCGLINLHSIILCHASSTKCREFILVYRKMFFIHRFISLNTSKLILDQNKVSSKIFLVLIWSCLLIIKSHWSKVYEKIKTKKEKMCTYQGNYFITLHPKQNKKNEILYSHPNVYNLVHLYYILCSNKDCLHKKWKHCVHWGRKNYSIVVSKYLMVLNKDCDVVFDNLEVLGWILYFNNVSTVTILWWPYDVAVTSNDVI